LSFGIADGDRQECLSYKTETPRLEPGRSLQQGCYTTTVLRIKVVQGRKEKSKPAALKPKAAAPGVQSREKRKM
jgi:hypothetical protein